MLILCIKSSATLWMLHSLDSTRRTQVVNYACSELQTPQKNPSLLATMWCVTIYYICTLVPKEQTTPERPLRWASAIVRFDVSQTGEDPYGRWATSRILNIIIQRADPHRDRTRLISDHLAALIRSASEMDLRKLNPTGPSFA